ncbi:MAG: hypothetical protein ACLPX7_21695 [Xanthobacteraceae bacterium]
MANQPSRRSAAPGTATKLPRRPDARLLSETIPLFFIERNKNGLWVAREAEGRAGGVFLLKRSALWFVKKNSVPVGCATMFLVERFELDVENQGNRLVTWLDAVKRAWRRLIPEYPPPMPIGRKTFKGEWR